MDEADTEVDNMIKLKDILNEDRSDPTKMFDQSTVDKIAADIKKLAKWEKKMYGNQSFEYSEYRFSTGGGGFSFKWDHARNWGGQIGDHLLQFWKKVKGDIKKNEAGAKASLDQEAKAQSAHYGSKSNTGRIGYGLSSQPRR